jgi:hypothetical protein
MWPAVYFDPEFKSVEEEEILLFSKLSQTTLGAHANSIQRVTRFYPGEKSGRNFKFSITSF